MNMQVRQAVLTEADIERLAHLIANRPPVPACVDSCKYDKQMEILNRWIANDIEKKANWKRIKSGVIVGSTVALIAALGKGSVWLVEFFANYWKGH
jgi:hypothetical protein